MTFVCGGFWLAVLFQFLYYRFLHPSHHVRLSTKQNISSFVRIRPLPRSERIKRTKSCEEIIVHNDRQNSNDINNDSYETTSLHFDTSIDERWHNRFAKENRQKLISQQQAIDQKVKLNRAQKQLEDAMKRRNKSAQGFLTKISTTFRKPTTVQTSLVKQSSEIQSLHDDNHQRLTKTSDQDLEEEDSDKSSLAHKSDKRTSQHQRQSKMYNINEDTHLEDNPNSTALHTNNTTVEGGDEMILTAAKLASHIIPASSSVASNN